MIIAGSRLPMSLRNQSQFLAGGMAGLADKRSNLLIGETKLPVFGLDCTGIMERVAVRAGAFLILMEDIDVNNPRYNKYKAQFAPWPTQRRSLWIGGSDIGCNPEFCEPRLVYWGFDQNQRLKRERSRSRATMSDRW